MSFWQHDYVRVKTPILVLVMLFFLPFSSGQAESLREEADRVCQAYIDKPDAFVAVNKKPDKCSPETGIDFGCAIYDIPMASGKLAYFWWPGTCGSASLGWVDKNNHFNDLLPINDESEAGALRSVSVVRHQNDNYILASRYGLFIDKVLPKGFVTLCGIYHHLDGWKDAEPKENPVCQMWARGEVSAESSILTGEISRIQEEALHLSGPEHIKSAVNVDFSGKGEKVQAVTVELVSGAGCGCSRVYLRILMPLEGKTNLSREKIEHMDKEIQNATRNELSCDKIINWKIIDIEGQKYISKDTILDEAETWHEQRVGYVDRVLFGYVDGKFQEICRQKPRTHLAIDRKNPDIKLIYKPIE